MNCHIYEEINKSTHLEAVSVDCPAHLLGAGLLQSLNRRIGRSLARRGLAGLDAGHLGHWAERCQTRLLRSAPPQNPEKSIPLFQREVGSGKNLLPPALLLIHRHPPLPALPLSARTALLR